MKQQSALLNGISTISVADYVFLLSSFDTHDCEPSPERCKVCRNLRQRLEYFKIVNFGAPKLFWFVTA